MFSLVWFRRENTKDGKHWEKNPPGPTNFYPPDWEENQEEKREKGGLAPELHIYPSPS